MNVIFGFGNLKITLSWMHSQLITNIHQKAVVSPQQKLSSIPKERD
jgi:hypothetical protein